MIFGSNRLRYIYFYDENFGWMIGGSGTMYSTKNGGINWFVEPSLAGNDLLCMHFGSSNAGWSSSISGTLFKYTGIPLSLTESEQPTDLTISQNYPNPFNPVTNINFNIPTTTDIILDFFDSTGQIVRTEKLYNLYAGEHNFLFDSKGLSSGVYYYRISFNTNVITRKMILIK
jgi:hypothetical protein